MRTRSGVASPYHSWPSRSGRLGAVPWSDRSSPLAPRSATIRASSPARSSNSVRSRRKPVVSSHLQAKGPNMTVVQKFLNKSARIVVVLESTTYPGTTEELLLPLFEARGARVGENFFLAFSPERIDPGNPAFKVKDIPKVVGGITPECTRLAAALYGEIVP